MANNTNFYKIHGFSAGTHTSASGHKVTVTREDLEKTAAALKSNYRVPFILGHSTHNRPDVVPAMGTVRDGKVDEDGNLYLLVEATKAGSGLIDGGYCENVSASFYSPDSPLNPTPGTWVMRHLASLGAEPPALKMLDPLLEIIPENFSESKHSHQWVTFSEDDGSNSLLFNGTGSVLPDNYEFKTFTKYGSSFRNKATVAPKCTAGNKLCHGKCIKQSWTCRDERKAITAPISKVNPINNGTSSTTSSTPRPLYDKASATKTEGSYTKNNTYTAPVPFDKNAAKEKQVKDNVTTGNLKALGALALTLAAEYGSDKVLPSNKEGQLAVKLLTGVATDQILLKNEATSSQRLQTAFFSGISKGTELGLTEAFSDNPFAATHAKATSGLLGVLLVDSGILDLPFDGYAKKMFYASSTMASAIRETKGYTANNKNNSASVNEKLNYATLEDVEKISNENVAQLLKKINAANSSSAKTSKDIKGQKELLEWLIKVLEQGSYDDCQHKLKEMSKANIRLNSSDYSEYTYEHTDTPITFTQAEALALMQPLALAMLKSMGVIDAAIIEEKKSKAKAVVGKSDPNLDAIFSEMKVVSNIKPDINNSALHDALYGVKPIIKVSEASDFSERPIEGRKRATATINNNGTDSFSEVTPSPRNKKLKIDILLDDALSMVNNFSEKRSLATTTLENSPVKKRARKFQSFQEREREVIPAPVIIDFKETDEYKSLVNELTLAKNGKRLVEIENFTEGLYKDGKLTEGIAKKSELVAFLMGLEQGSKEFNFGEGVSVSNPYNFMEKLLHNIEPLISFSEVATSAAPDIMFQPKFDMGFDVDSQKLDYRISELMKKDPSITYVEALKKLT